MPTRRSDAFAEVSFARPPWYFRILLQMVFHFGSGTRHNMVVTIIQENAEK
jgi:hypothetical protein